MPAPIIPSLLTLLRSAASGAAIRLASAASGVGRTVKAAGAALQTSPAARGAANRAKTLTGQGGRKEAASGAAMSQQVTQVFKQVLGGKSSTLNRIYQTISPVLDFGGGGPVNKQSAAAAKLDPNEMPRFSDPIIQASVDDAGADAKKAEAAQRYEGIRSKLKATAVAAALMGGFVGLGKYIVGLGRDLRDWAQTVVESRRALAKWNSQISAGFQRLDIGRMQRSIESARATAGTTQFALSGVNQLEKALQPLNDFRINLQNLHVGAITRGVTEMVLIGKQIVLAMPFVKRIATLLEAMNDNNGEPVVQNLWMKDMADGKFIRPRENLPPLNPPRIR